MPVAMLVVELSIEGAHSLKDRRQVVRSIKDKVRHGFNVSVAEMDDATLWNRAVLGVAAIHGSREYLMGQMREVEDAMQRLAVGLGAAIVESSAELLN